MLFTCARKLMSPLTSFAVTMGPVSWTYPAELVCTKRSDALRPEGLTPIYMAVLSESPWKSRVTRHRKSLSFPNHLYHNRRRRRLLCARHPIGHLTLLSLSLFHRVSTLLPGKPTLSLDLSTLPPSSKFISCTPKQSDGRWKKLKKFSTKATRSLHGRLERTLGRRR